MELEVKKIIIDSFRGVQHREIEFDGNTKIKGCNGSGKSSIMSSFLWALADVDSKMTKNPDVVPIGWNEANPTVEIEFELDGKPLTVCKTQKFKKKEVDGKVTSSITNSYSINGIEKSLKAFVEDLTERGIDMEHFLFLSHPDAFTADVSAKGREKIREILFGMIDGVSDLEIAKTINLPQLTALLEEKGYKIEEVESMAKSSLRKLNDKYGKNNEIIDGRIAGIMQSKSNANVSELEKQKSTYEDELEQVRKEYENLKKADSETEGKIAELEGKSIELERTLQHELDDIIAAASEKLRKQEKVKNDAEIEMINKKHEVDRLFADREGITDSLENYRNLYKKVLEETFDENTLKCPCCGRKYSSDKADKMKQTFEDSKAKRLNDYKSRGETFAKQLDSVQQKYEKANETYEKAHKVWLKADSKAQNLHEELMMIPRRPNLSENETYQNIKSEIEKLRKELTTKDDLRLQELSNRENYLIQMIKQIIGELAVVDRNKELDIQIADLRTEKKDAEIQRAKSEQLIDQVKTFVMYKNNLLTEQINKRFDGVSFRLFKPQKNGEIIECLDVLVDGKEINSQANQALQVKAKLALIKGLSLFWNAIYPVFVDDASLMTQETLSTIDMPNQMIWLCAADGYKELTIENA